MNALLLLGTPLLVLPVVLLLGSLGCAVGAEYEPGPTTPSILVTYAFGETSAVHELNVEVWMMNWSGKIVNGPYTSSNVAPKLTTGVITILNSGGPPFRLDYRYRCWVQVTDDAGPHKLDLTREFTALPIKFHVARENGKFALSAGGAA